MYILPCLCKDVPGGSCLHGGTLFHILFQPQIEELVIYHVGIILLGDEVLSTCTVEIIFPMTVIAQLSHYGYYD